MQNKSKGKMQENLIDIVREYFHSNTTFNTLIKKMVQESRITINNGYMKKILT